MRLPGKNLDLTEVTSTAGQLTLSKGNKRFVDQKPTGETIQDSVLEPNPVETLDMRAAVG